MTYCDYCSRDHNVGFVSTRIAGTDGVSLEAEKWARQSGAARMQMIAPNERVGRFYRRLGYDHIESNYQLNLRG